MDSTDQQPHSKVLASAAVAAAEVTFAYAAAVAVLAATSSALSSAAEGLEIQELPYIVAHRAGQGVAAVAR